jgi:hypothetical protein
MRHLTKLLAVAVVLLAGGCKHTLQEGGAYTSPAVYDAELTIVTSWEILDTCMSWEEQNRAALAKHPEVYRVLDAIRAKAPAAHLRAIRLVDIYNDSLTDVDKSAAERAVVALRQLATEALSVMTEYGL